MYGSLVIAYLFCGGTAAGGFFVMSAWSLGFERICGHKRVRANSLSIERSKSCEREMFGTSSLCDRRRASGRKRLTYRTSAPASAPAASAAGASVRQARAFAALKARTYTACSILLVLGCLFLLWDLGHPERMLLVFLRPHATVLTFGVFCLSAEIALGLLLMSTSLFGIPALSPRTQRAVEAACCVTSLLTMAYTGVFLTSNLAVPFWGSPTLVAVFTCSSLSCGVSLVLLVDYFIANQTLLLSAVRPLQACHLVCLAAEAISITLFIAAAFNNPSAAAACALLTSPDMLATATVGVAGFGIALPAMLETYALLCKSHRAIPVSDALCLCGGACLRYCIIICGIG